MVVRLPAGAGTGAAAQHSQSLEAWLTHVPGLKVVYPSCAQDALGPVSYTHLDVYKRQVLSQLDSVFVISCFSVRASKNSSKAVSYTHLEKSPG